MKEFLISWWSAVQMNTGLFGYTLKACICAVILYMMAGLMSLQYKALMQRMHLGKLSIAAQVFWSVVFSVIAYPFLVAAMFIITAIPISI